VAGGGLFAAGADAGAGDAAVDAAFAASVAAGVAAGGASLSVISPSCSRRCQYWVTWPMFWPVAGNSVLVPGMGTDRPGVGMANMRAPVQKARDDASRGGRS